MSFVKCIILRSKFLISKWLSSFQAEVHTDNVSVTRKVLSMEPWNFKKSKGRKPLRLEKGKNRRKYCEKILMQALSIPILS